MLDESRVFSGKSYLVFVLIPLLLLTACKGKAPKPASRPSVLLVTLDTTRADRLGAYGSSAGLTPFLDAYAAKSFVFTRCESAVPLTLPSHTSIMSGYLPVHHGVRVNVEMAVPKDVPLLAVDFKRAGYSTGAFVSSTVLLKRYGLDRGFERYDQSFYNSLEQGHQKASAKETLSKALEWIREQKGPVFCWIHLYDPHVPYAAPEPFGSRYKKDPYDGEIAYMDSQLGAFWKSLSTSVDTNKLLTVFCADHGESLGEHGELDHGIFLYECTMHVPLIIHLPAQREARRVSERVSLVDVAPTILDETGLPPNPGADGKSLVPLLNGGKMAKRDFLLESMNGLMTYGWAPLFGLVSGNYKYILAPKPELYDLAKDPEEKNNLVTKFPDIAANMRSKISSIQEAIKTKTSAAPETQTSEEELNQLESLGYLGGTFSSNTISHRDPKDYISLEKPIIQANILIAKGKNKAALRLLKDIAKKDPDNPFILFLKGQAYVNDRPAKAIGLWKKAVKLDPDYQMAWTEWVVTLMNEGKNAEAAQVANLGISSCDDRLGVLHLALAEKSFLDGAPENVVMENINRALALNPDLARAYLLHGLVLLRAGKTRQADIVLKSVWQHATVAEVDRWKKDPAFKAVFAVKKKMVKGSR